MSSLKENSLFIDVIHETTICSDGDDNKFLELAVSGMANSLITGDNDLLIIKAYQCIPIITSADFVSFFKNN